MSYTLDPNKPFVLAGDESKGGGWAAEERSIVTDPWSLPPALALRIHETYDKKWRYVFCVKFFRYCRDEVLFNDTHDSLFWMADEGKEVLEVVSWSFLQQWVSRFAARHSPPLYFPHPMREFWLWRDVKTVEGEFDDDDSDADIPVPRKQPPPNFEEAEYEEI